MEKLRSLVSEVLEITYGKYGMRWREQLYETDRVTYHIMVSEGSLYERIHKEELAGQREEGKE